MSNFQLIVRRLADVEANSREFLTPKDGFDIQPRSIPPELDPLVTEKPGYICPGHPALSCVEFEPLKEY